MRVDRLNNSALLRTLQRGASEEVAAGGYGGGGGGGGAGGAGASRMGAAAMVNGDVLGSAGAHTRPLFRST